MVKFPEALPKEEQRKLLSKLPNQEAKTILLERNLRLVAKTVASFENIKYDEMEDFISIGCIGLIKAIDTFDNSRDIEFSTYARICIKNEILKFLGKDKKYAQTNDLRNKLKVDNNWKEQDDIYIERNFDNEENNEIIFHILNTVSNILYNQSLKEVIIFFYLIGRKNQSEIAQLFGMGRYAIVHRKRKFRELCKDLMYKDVCIEEKYINFYREEEYLIFKIGNTTMKRSFDSDSFIDFGDELLKNFKE